MGEGEKKRGERVEERRDRGGVRGQRDGEGDGERDI